MKIKDIIAFLESWAPASLQEHYDNAGLIMGNGDWDCSGVLVSLDATEPVVMEAIEKKCNLIVAHHPIIFGGLKKINGKNYVEKTVITAIKNDIAVYAIHTNLDNIISGVNGKIAEKLGLQDISILSAKEHSLKKLYTFVPADHAENVRNAIFEAGAGHIGNYSECSFSSEGTGTFKAGEGADPFVGKKGERHHEKEIRVEALFPAYLEHTIIAAMRSAHPYEEVAFDVVALSNTDPRTGSGIIGNLQAPVYEKDFLEKLKKLFGLELIRHTAFTGEPVQKVAVCGGAGSFLISKALAAGAHVYITADVKYHEFFNANGKMLIADIGHYESEQFTIDLLHQHLEQKFPTFAVLKSGIRTNPVFYC